MTIALNKPKLDNLANEIWKSAIRLRGKFKAYEYQNVILPMIVIRRLECVLLAWREVKRAEINASLAKIADDKLSALVKRMATNPKQAPCRNSTDFTRQNVYEDDPTLRDGILR